MAERPGPKVYSIAAHRGFADALVAGLIPRYAEPELGLARLTLLLPSRRAARTVTEAFVRLSQGGLLLPRMVVVGELDLDEALGPLLDPLSAGSTIAPAADPVRRWLRMAEFLRLSGTSAEGSGAALLRRAHELGQTLDRLLAEGIDPASLLTEPHLGILGEQAGHWRDATREFLLAYTRWQAELEQRGEQDAPSRRNALFVHAARQWAETPPPFPVVAAGVTNASPALAGLLRVVADMPQGAVILPDLDLAMDEDVWRALGHAGMPEDPADPPFGTRDAVTHPQYHLKLLLNRMGISRGEVQAWHRAGLAASPADRSRAISSLFLPPRQSARWVDMPAAERRLAGVRVITSAHPGEEAQALAVLIRQALEVPEKRVALITPDRGLASRVVAHLRRWGIEADDTAGQPLAQTAAGRLLLLLAELVAEQFAPVPLIALLSHPRTRAGEGRAAWLEATRRLDLILRGPRPAPGLAALAEKAEAARLGEWWAEAGALLQPLAALGGEGLLAELLDVLVKTGEALCGPELWRGADGRALSAFVAELHEAARDTGSRLDARELHAVLAEAMERVAVRPPWGGHPRVAIYGLLEARMARAELVLCGGMVEGVWPGSPTPDALLPPAVLRALGVPGADFRIGLAAHDLAAALGAPEVVLSHAERDESGPVIASRFLLRIGAMLGKEAMQAHRDPLPVGLARAIDRGQPEGPCPRPEPRPDAEQRRVSISATGLDRLRSDPYQFYASAILRLKRIDGLDVQPSAAWRGEAVHAILEHWHMAGAPAGQLVEAANRVLDRMSAHPLARVLWRPRLVAALEWIDAEVVRLAEEEGRSVALSEEWGHIDVKGVRVLSRADRIDRMADGRLAIVDYKTGKPPSRSMVQQGFALQLGVIGLIAREGGFQGVHGEPERFEYWSFGSNKASGGFGYREEPILEGSRKTGIPREDFLPETERFLADAIDRWILGTAPFTARLNPDLAVYNDYDHLMRLDEWLPGLKPDGAAEA